MPRVVLVLGLFFLAGGHVLLHRQLDTPTFHAGRSQGTLAHKVLRGGAPFHERMRELARTPNHWDIPLEIPEKDMDWWMFARVVEKRVLLAVHEGYIVAWCTTVAFLLLSTGAFVAWSRSAGVKDTSDMCKPFREVPTGESEESTKVLVQKGFVSSSLGHAIFWMWVLLPLLGYFQMALLCLDHYFFVMHEPDPTWNQWAQPYLLVFCLSHLTLFLQTQFLARARVFFMLPAPLDSASQVLVQDTGSSTDGGALVEVQSTTAPSLSTSGKEDLQTVRFFEHTCVRYLWSDADHCFEPVGTETGLSGKEAARRVQQGGLNQEQFNERKVVGPNEIRVPVPGVPASLAEEFLTPLYVLQFAAMWLYFFIDGWNIAFVWLVWTLTAGISKSLCVVRRSRLQVQELARTHASSTVLREGRWSCLPSSEVVPGDVIQVDEGVVTCDVVVVKGSAVVNESMLTGEPMPVQRFSVEDVETSPVATSSHKKHILFTGTVVMQSAGDPTDANDTATGYDRAHNSLLENRCIGVVFKTGPMTMKGSLIRTVLFPEPVSFKFTDQLPRVYLLMFIYVCMLFIAMQVFADSGSWIFGIYIGFTILVQSLNPLLPVSITFGQTRGSEQLKQDLGISCLSPERLPIAGKVHVMVMDKTGTITKEGMEFRGAHIAQAGAFSDMPFWADDGHLDPKGIPEEVVWALASCHTVSHLNDGTLVGNMVEVAMLKASGYELSQDSTNVCGPAGEKIQILKNLEFDQTRMTSGSVIRVQGRTLALIKGSYERIGELTTSGVPKDFKQVTEGFAGDQYYVLGFGMKVLGDKGETAPRAELEQDLAFLGLFLFRNEMKSDSPDAVAALKEGSTHAVICTGDNALTGAAIGRACGVVNPNRPLILGDVEKGSLCWTRQDKHFVNGSLMDKAPVPHLEVIESNQDAELVLTKTAFRELKYAELLQVISRVRVYARMKPDDKVAVVQSYQDQGLVVGMVGDGGNDCGAMRAAHVGLALSDAEASIVAPFSSSATYGTGEKSLMAVPHLLRYGRATLQTNFGTFLFFMCYGLGLPTTKLFLTVTSNAMMAEWNWLFIDLVLGVLFVILMTRCRPAEKLAPIRPTAALLEGRSISSVLLHMSMFFAFLALALNILWAQPFHVSYNTRNINIPAHEWAKKGDNFDCAVTFLVLATQLVTAGYAGSLGAEHRKSVLKDWGLTLTFVAIITFLLVLVIGGPSDLHCIMRTNCDSNTSRNMAVPFIEEFSAGNVGGCFLGPQLQGWKEEYGDKFQFPDEDSNMCFPAEGVDPEKKVSVPSEALFGLGKAMCSGAHNCFSGLFRIYFAVILLGQCGLSILAHQLLLSWHPAVKEHFKTV